MDAVHSSGGTPWLVGCCEVVRSVVQRLLLTKAWRKLVRQKKKTLRTDLQQVSSSPAKRDVLSEDDASPTNFKKLNFQGNREGVRGQLSSIQAPGDGIEGSADGSCDRITPVSVRMGRHLGNETRSGDHTGTTDRVQLPNCSAAAQTNQYTS